MAVLKTKQSAVTCRTANTTQKTIIRWLNAESTKNERRLMAEQWSYLKITNQSVVTCRLYRCITVVKGRTVVIFQKQQSNRWLFAGRRILERWLHAV